MTPPANAAHPTPPFPHHADPRIWFLTSAASPLAVQLTRSLLSHGDLIAGGIRGSVLDRTEDDGHEWSRAFRALREEAEEEGWLERWKIVRVDVRNMGECQSAVAKVVGEWGRIDILVTGSSESVVGTVEELSTSPGTLTLIREQFETNFYGPVNIIKAVLPGLRERRSGHILVVTGITSHIGTPSLGMYCASSWALEGFCDSLAYEVAPFNIKLTIIQPNMEVVVLTNKITFAPPLPQYANPSNPGSGLRALLAKMASPGQGQGKESGGSTSSRPKTNRVGNDQSPTEIVSMFPSLPQSATDALLEETIHALTAIAGHENPPARHIVGHAGVASVKEKLKTVTQELEDFVDVSAAVDIFKEDDGATAAGAAAPEPTDPRES